MRGRFITFEGGEGAGKSTHAATLAHRLKGIGIGVEFVTIDTYLTELVPRERRGAAFAFTATISLTAYPTAAFLAFLLVPRTPLGVDGWRWVTLVGAGGAIIGTAGRRRTHRRDDLIGGIPVARNHPPHWLRQRKGLAA